MTQVKDKGIALPIQAWTGPEGGYQEVEALRFHDNRHKKVKVKPYTLAAFTPRKYSWYSFLLEAKLTPGPQCGQRDYVNEINDKSSSTIQKELNVFPWQQWLCECTKMLLYT